jgi:hypothetical protein
MREAVSVKLQQKLANEQLLNCLKYAFNGVLNRDFGEILRCKNGGF